MKSIAGFDLSMNTGFALIVERGDEVMTYAGLFSYSAKDRLEQRLLAFQRDLTMFIRAHRPTAIIYEGAHMRGGASTRSALGFETILRVTCWEQKVPIHVVHSRTLKKFATGHGGAEKVDMIQAAHYITGYKTSNDNVADALCLAAWGRVYVDEKGELIEAPVERKKRKRMAVREGENFKAGIDAWNKRTVAALRAAGRK